MPSLHAVSALDVQPPALQFYEAFTQFCGACNTRMNVDASADLGPFNVLFYLWLCYGCHHATGSYRHPLGFLGLFASCPVSLLVNEGQHGLRMPGETAGTCKATPPCRALQKYTIRKACFQ